MVAQEHVPAYVREHGPLETPVRALRLADEIALLKREPSWDHNDRATKTLAKEGHLAIVLSVMRAGAQAKEHQVAGPVTVHCLEGSLRLRRAEQSIDLNAGDIAVLDADVVHSHEALTDCAILLTVTH